MDWTAVGNAKGPVDRIRAIFYLCRFRYEANPREAGVRLAAEPETNKLCGQAVSEIRAELTAPSTDLGPVAQTSDHDIRTYLKILLEAYDEICPKSDPTE